MVHVPLMILSEWREFPSTPCLAEKRNLVTTHVSMLLKWRASLDILPSGSVAEKTCNSAPEQNPFSKDTIDPVLRHGNLGRAKDLLAPPRSDNNYSEKECIRKLPGTIQCVGSNTKLECEIK